MPPEDTEDKILAYLLGELTPDEEKELQDTLETDASAAQLADCTEKVLTETVLALTPLVDPPSHLLGRVERAIRRGDQPEAGEPIPKRSNLLVFVAAVGWAAAAAFVFLFLRADQRADRMASLSFNNFESILNLRLELSDKDVEVESLMGEREDLLQTVEGLSQQRRLDSLRIASLASELDQLYHGFTVWDDSSAEGVTRVYNLPELKDDQDYQLWVVDPNYENPLDGGVFQVGPDGNAEYRFSCTRPVENAVAFAVSLERKGGVPVAEGPMMLVGKP